jgi:hypothetical protein
VLLVDERILADGRRARMWLGAIDGGRVAIQCDDGQVPAGASLSVVAIDRVMAKYGVELDPEHDVAPPATADRLELDQGFVIRRLQFRARVDAISRDYLVWERPHHPPVAALATQIAAVLHYLVLRVASEN